MSNQVHSYLTISVMGTRITRPSSVGTSIDPPINACTHTLYKPHNRAEPLQSTHSLEWDVRLIQQVNPVPLEQQVFFILHNKHNIS